MGDKDGSGEISRQEFDDIVLHQTALKALEGVDVDPVGIVDYADLFFEDDDEEPLTLNFEKFFEMIMKLRDSNNATVKDVKEVWKKTKEKMSKNHKNLLNAENHVKELTEGMNKYADDIINMLDE